MWFVLFANSRGIYREYEGLVLAFTVISLNWIFVFAIVLLILLKSSTETMNEGKETGIIINRIIRITLNRCLLTKVTDVLISFKNCTLLASDFLCSYFVLLNKFIQAIFIFLVDCLFLTGQFLHR
jgi:hypothetical protein